jgi:hypothetical protein
MGRRSGLRELDEVAAGVIEDGHCCRPNLRWVHREHDTHLLHSLGFFPDVVNEEGRQRDSLREERGFERLGCWLLIRLQEQLHAIRIFGRDDRQPFEVPYGEILFLLEPQRLRNPSPFARTRPNRALGCLSIRW